MHEATGAEESRRITICHVAVGDLWAGAEVQLKNLLSELVQYAEFELSVVLFNGGRLAEEISHLGIQLQIFSEKAWNSIKIARALGRHFNSARFDIVHTHKYKDTILSAPVAHSCGVPHVVRSVHGLTEPFTGVRGWKMLLYELVERRVCERYVQTLIAVSSDIESKLRQNFPRTEVICIRNGIVLNAWERDSERIETRKAFGVPKDAFLIGSVGRLTPVKGLPHLIRAVQILTEQRLPVKCWFIGDGLMKEELSRLAEEVGVAKHVAMLGHRHDLHQLMRALDVFVLPSLHEGIPMALLEAMATGLPVIATRVGGIPEVIEDRVSGILIEPGDSGGLAVMCGRLMNDAELAERLGQAAKARVKERFSSGTMAAEVANVYRRLIGHANG